MLSRLIRFALLGALSLPAAELTLTSGEVGDDQAIVLHLALKDGHREITALQCDLEADANLTVTAEAGDGAKETNKEVQIFRRGEGKYRLVIAGLNQKGLLDGSIARVRITLQSDAKQGRRHSLRLVDAVGSNKDAEAIPVDTPNVASVTERAGRAEP